MGQNCEDIDPSPECECEKDIGDECPVRDWLDKHRHCYGGLCVLTPTKELGE